MAHRFDLKQQEIRLARSHRPSQWNSSSRPFSNPPHNPTLSFPSSNTNTATTTHHNAFTKKTTHSEARGRILSPFEQRERRAKGLCFNCDEAYSSTHICPTPADFTDSDEPPPPIEENPPEETPIIPFHAINNSTMGEMMRFKGSITHQPINIFIDCGAAMNLLNPKVADDLGLTIEDPPPHLFTTASGHNLSPSGVVHNVTVEIQGYQYTNSFLLLPVPGCDLVLGAQWLDSLGYIGWHLLEKVMFVVNGKKYVLQGVSNRTHSLDVLGLLGLLPSDHIDLIAQLLPSETQSNTTTHVSAITILLQQFSDLFEPPSTLPPCRAIDHRIPLLPNTKLVNVRPYHYAHSQKAELESQVQEMLANGTIRPSCSPYSSPVLLVRKKEGSWRFCVDYRALNAVTIKDRFPIPVVDELLDELHGSSFFTKLDLRSGYHQIRMFEEDIPKTAFRTHDGHYEFVVMPFGLSNAPSTFQALMNHIFKPFLRKFVLVFFDDILIYSKDLDSHLSQLLQVFDSLREHCLKVKLSKCSFAQSQVQYLGHVISQQGVSVNPSKIQCIVDWPQPQTLKALRGFLGLTGYYRKFVAHYGIIAKPLSDMLKTNNFVWSPASEAAFATLKNALTTAPILALPDFSHPFVIETDASGTGIGAILQQHRHPIAYLSKSLSPKNQALSVYEKEMMAILYAVDKWRHYVLGQVFTILTDHKTLKHMLDQRITTPAQHHWLSKLLGYNYKVEYRVGNLNTVADALSRVELYSIQAFSNPIFDCLPKIDRACANDPEAQQVITALQQHLPTKKHFSWVHNRLLYKDKVFVPRTSDWRLKLLHEFHSSLQAGHSGYLRTYLRISKNFAWPGMRKEVKSFVVACDQCQRQSYETIHPPGLLQPLPIPDNVFFDISMDFVDGLPLSQGKSSILVVVDRLSKYSHFHVVAHPYTAATIADLFLKEIFRLHGMPRNIVSDRGSVFVSQFWEHFFKLHGTKLCRSSAYHPQLDGQIEVVNRSLEHYLRCFASDKPASWASLLHWAEWWYNTTYHSTIKMTPFQALYGSPPPTISMYLPGSTAVHAVDVALRDRDSLLRLLKSNMDIAQNRMKQHSDQKRTEREFNEGDWVYLKLHPYCQQSLVKRPAHKLAPRFYGPFQIAARVGTVAYRLALPPH